MKNLYRDARPDGIPKTWKGKGEEYGEFVYCWPYLSTDGTKILGWDVRYEFPDGSKKVIPFFNSGEEDTWKFGLATDSCPLFGLDWIGGYTRVYIAEGCKAATAIHRMGLPCVSSQGGCNKAAQSDWAGLLSVREVVILPDNDDHGADYAREVAEILKREYGDQITVSDS